MEGLVVGEDRRGAVAPMTEADLRDLPQDIEVLAVTTSARRGDDLWEADLVRAFHHMKLLTPGSPNYLVEAVRHGIRLGGCVSARPAAGGGLLHAAAASWFDQFMRYPCIAPRHVACSGARHRSQEAARRDPGARQPQMRGSHPRHMRMLDVIVEAVRPLNKR